MYKLYGLKSDNVNEASFLKFTASKITPLPQKLRPTRDALLCHCKRVSYVTAMVKSALDGNFVMPSPNGHGWKIVDGKVCIEWMLLPAAPDQVLLLIACNCKKSACKRAICISLSHALTCTDLCGCREFWENKDSSGSSDEADSSDDDMDREDD